MSVTRDLVSRSHLVLIPEISPDDRGYQCFNGGSVEAEVGEFLYALVRLVKPGAILETGTHVGISSAYMAEALERNQGGTLTTLEFDAHYVAESKALWGALGLLKRIEGIHTSSQDYHADRNYELLFLDSEPQLRFDEFVKFWPNVTPGGFILIHDLGSHLGHSGLVVDGMRDWPFGDFRPKLGHYITSHQMQVINFPSPRGFTLFQKTAPEFAHDQLLRGQL